MNIKGPLYEFADGCIAPFANRQLPCVLYYIFGVEVEKTFYVVCHYDERVTLG